MESTEKEGLAKETNVWGELAGESTPSQTPRIFCFPTSLQQLQQLGSLAKTRFEWIAVFESYMLLRQTTRKLMNKEKWIDYRHKLFFFDHSKKKKSKRFFKESTLTNIVQTK